jgi:hypothetical protein
VRFTGQPFFRFGRLSFYKERGQASSDNKRWHEIAVGGVFKVGSQRLADDGKLTKANFIRLLYKRGGCRKIFRK